VDTVPIIVAIVVVIAIGGLITVLLRRSGREARATPPADADEPLSTLDERFRLLSFQGGSQPADLGPMLEELRRNGIEIDEETLRNKLAERASTTAERPGTTDEP
jgi:hypothetical protein